MFVVYVGQHPHDDPVPPRARRRGQRIARLHRPRDGLAVVHGAVRELRRVARRRPRQGAGGHAARRAARRRGEEARASRATARPRRRCRARRCASATSCRRGGRFHSGGRRRDRRRRLGRRERHHGRVARPSSASRAATSIRVTGGTRLLSDWLVVRVNAESGRDLPRPHDRHGRGGAQAEDAERDRARDPARRAHADLPLCHGDAAAVLHLQRERRGGGRAGVDHRCSSRCSCA